MTDPRPYAALDDALSQARYLLLDFNRTICDLYAGQPAEAVAGALRAALAKHAPQMPAQLLASADPLAVLAHAQAVSADLARLAEAELTRHELDAVPSAEPTAYLHDAISSARESRRAVAVLGTCSAQAMHAYLASASLDDLVEIVVGRTRYSPVPTENDLITQALSALTANPADCVVVTGSAALIEAANSAGLSTIGYAHEPATRAILADHATATITSLADLVLRLRARPLPN